MKQAKYVPTRVVADRWGVSQSTVRRLVDRGKLRGIRVEGRYQIDEASITEYEGNHRVPEKDIEKAQCLY